MSQINLSKANNNLSISASSSQIEEAEEEEDSNLSKSEGNDKEDETNNIRRLLMEESILNQSLNEAEYTGLELMEGNRFKDELQEIYSIILDNIKDFKLEFEIDRNVYIEDGFVKRYIKYINKRQYTDFLIPPIENTVNITSDSIKEEFSDIKETDQDNMNWGFGSKLDEDQEQSKVNTTHNISSSDSKYSSSLEKTQSEIEKRDFKTDLSVSILYEVISCEYLHMNHYYKNFYYREIFQEKLVDLEFFINKFLYNDQSTNNEMSDSTKVVKAMNFFVSEIFMRWKNLFEKESLI